MSNLDPCETKLLEGWEEVFKRGQLSFWTLLSPRDGPGHMAQVRRWSGDIPVGDRVLSAFIERDVMSFLKADVVRLLDLPA